MTKFQEIASVIGLPLFNKLVVDEIELSYDEAGNLTYDPETSKGYLSAKGLYEISNGERIHRALAGGMGIPPATSVSITHQPNATGVRITFYAEQA